MKKNPVLTALFLLCILPLHAQTDSISSPRVWLRSDKSVLTPTKWTDVGFFKSDAVAGAAKEAPALTGSINFNKALVFDGLDDYFKIPVSLEGLPDLAILAVFQSADTTERGVWGTEQSVSRNILLTTRKAIGPDTIADAYGKNEHVTILNSVLQSWENATTVSSTAFLALGSAGKTKGFKPFKGSFAELIVFNRSITFLQRLQYETYLAIKYGTGLRGGNFISSNKTVLWRVEENKTYGRNIAGIGRDDYFNLYQKQSGSAYDSGLVVMSAATLEKTNEENSGKLEDQDFIVWGDNGLPLTARRGTGPDSVLSMTQRKWLVTVTGSRKPAEVYIDAAKLPKNALGYWLVIDRSGQGNFSVDNLEYISPDRVSNGKIIYKNVVWDSDGSGKDNFSFAQTLTLFAVVRRLSNPSCTNETAGKIKIEIVSGKGPFQYSLNNEQAKISRDWKHAEKTTEQKELVAGKYSLLVEDANDEHIDRRFTMIMPDALTINLGPDQRLATSKDIILDVSAQVPDSIPVSYHWENNFGFSSNEQKIKVTEAGIYRVFVTKKKDGCIFTDDTAVSGSESQRVAVYPSIVSSNENYNISVSLDEPGNVLVKVFNTRGVQVHQVQGAGQSEFQFISSLKDSGMYMVVIQTPKGIETRKIVVQ
jgi:hypothetical protein